MIEICETCGECLKDCTCEFEEIENKPLKEAKKMKTRADLIRDLTIGKQLMLTKKFGKPTAKLRTVIRVQTDQICLQTEEGKKSWLEIPKATLTEYDGSTLKIFGAGTRDLTEEEKEVKNNEPKDDKQDETDLMTDTNTMFYRRMKYYKDSGLFYLFGTQKEKGKRFTHNNGGKIVDDTIKGQTELEYEII